MAYKPLCSRRFCGKAGAARRLEATQRRIDSRRYVGTVSGSVGKSHCPMADPSAATNPPEVGADDYAGRDAQPVSQLVSLPQPCTPPPIHSRTWRRPLRVSFRQLLSSRSSRQVLGRLQPGLAAIAAGIPASIDQSAGLGGLAVSLHACSGTRIPSMCQPMTQRRAVGISRGCTGVWNGRQVCGAARPKAGTWADRQTPFL